MHQSAVQFANIFFCRCFHQAITLTKQHFPPGNGRFKSTVAPKEVLPETVEGISLSAFDLLTAIEGTMNTITQNLAYKIHTILFVVFAF